MPKSFDLVGVSVRARYSAPKRQSNLQAGWNRVKFAPLIFSGVFCLFLDVEKSFIFKHRKCVVKQAVDPLPKATRHKAGSASGRIRGDAKGNFPWYLYSLEFQKTISLFAKRETVFWLVEAKQSFALLRL